MGNSGLSSLDLILFAGTTTLQKINEHKTILKYVWKHCIGIHINLKACYSNQTQP